MRLGNRLDKLEGGKTDGHFIFAQIGEDETFEEAIDRKVKERRIDRSQVVAGFLLQSFYREGKQRLRCHHFPQSGKLTRDDMRRLQGYGELEAAFRRAGAASYLG